MCGIAIIAANGYLVWKSAAPDWQHYDFKILHHGKCDRIFDYPCSSALQEFIGDLGLTRLTSMLSMGLIKVKLGQGSVGKVPGVKNLDEFVDLFRRLQMPYYEEARLQFDNREFLETFSDANEISPYLPRALERIVVDMN